MGLINTSGNRPNIARFNIAQLASGRSQKTTPDSFVGALSSFNRQGIKALCFECGETKPITKVTGIEQHESHADYTVILECQHPRIVSLAVSRSEANKRALDASRKKAAAAKKRLLDAADVPETDPETELTDQIRQDMQADGTLIGPTEEVEPDEPDELGQEIIGQEEPESEEQCPY